MGYADNQVNHQRGEADLLGRNAHGVFTYEGARIVDRAGMRRLPIGNSSFETAAESSVLIDKSLLIADIIDSGYYATLFCRPRRFGKTFNMTMMRAFFEMPVDAAPQRNLFEGMAVWDARGGVYRAHYQAYPVVYLSLRTAKGSSWNEILSELKNLIAAEYARHAYLERSEQLDPSERAYCARIKEGSAPTADYYSSLSRLVSYLHRHHRARSVVLIDEYDAPVMAAFAAGRAGEKNIYDQAVGFLKGWLTGGLKDNPSLAFACLTGVQRISKESIFSDLNNLSVSTALDTRFDERFGFTEAEVRALAAYLGREGGMAEARAWYDGYRFGGVDVYNPWSTLCYFDRACAPDVYWGNTADNAVVGSLVRSADADTLEEVYALLRPGGTVLAPLDLGAVFPELGVTGDALWSMLYLAGYLTTEDTAQPNDTLALRRLRIPNQEVARLYRREIVERFAQEAGGAQRLRKLQAALTEGNAPAVERELNDILVRSVSFYDGVSENSYHMLMLGLCYGMPGYADPVSNREAGSGRFDIQLAPDGAGAGRLPLITIEIKFLKAGEKRADAEALAGKLSALADGALRQIDEKGYDVASQTAAAAVRWGLAFSGKQCACRARAGK